MRSSLMLSFFVVLTACVQAQASATRSQEADSFKSSDHTKTWSLPSASDTLLGRSSTDTLTNKSISGSTNTLTNLNASNISTGTLAVARGGTGTSTGSITGTTALTFAAGGTNQNINLTPSGTGHTVLNGGMQVSSSGSVIANILVSHNISVSVPSIGLLGGSASTTVTISGAAVGDVVSLSPRAALPNNLVISYARVSAANTVTIMFHNTGNSSSTTVAFDFTLVR